jgi:hypothetical protein
MTYKEIILRFLKRVIDSTITFVIIELVVLACLGILNLTFLFFTWIFS